jgi:nucleoside-diphosphate-sugar epimerase
MRILLRFNKKNISKTIPLREIFVDERRNMKPKTLAITGISGYSGKVLMPLLEKDQDIEKVIGVDIQPPPDGEKWKKIEFHQMDIRDPGLEKIIHGADTLVHLAFILMRKPNDNEIDDVNIRGTQEVIKIAGRLGIPKLIITSSVVAYGLHADNPIPLTEETPLRPNTNLYYSYAKAANEKYLDQFCQEHQQMVVTRLRPPTVVGPSAVKELMAQVVADVIPVIRGYDPPIQLLHEQDLAQALYMVICEDMPGIYNVTSDEPRTIRQLAQSSDVRVIPLPGFIVWAMSAALWRFGLSPFSPEFIDLLSRYPIIASSEKFKARGWEPKYTTREAYLSVREAFGKEH